MGSQIEKYSHFFKMLYMIHADLSPQMTVLIQYRNLGIAPFGQFEHQTGAGDHLRHYCIFGRLNPFDM